MRRDGRNISFWQDEKYYPTEEAMQLPSEYDVIIVGGGMTGIVTAYNLQNAGRNVIVLEAYNPGFGTTGGTTAHLNTILDTPYSTISKNFSEDASRTVANAAKDAIVSIKQNIQVNNIECEFEEADAFLFSQDEKEEKFLNEIKDYTNRAGVNFQESREIPITTNFINAIRVPGQAKFHPMKYLLAMSKAFQEKGGRIITNCRVNGFEENDGMVLLKTSQGDISGVKVIFATHIPIGVNLIHLRCAPWRSYAMALTLKSGRYPEGLIYDMKDPYHYYRTQIIDGKPVLIVGGEDHKTGEIENTETCFLRLRSHIQKIFDIDEITHHWSSQYFEPADGLPYIGVLPGHSDNVLVATGFGGNGMIYSHVSARELTERVISGKSLFDDLFSPSRIKPVAGFTNFIGHNANVVKNFLTKWFSAEALESLTGLAPGEGKIVTYEGSDIAVSKDESGVVHAVSPSCTHLKCNVAWNDTEGTWDCPCHGARYSPEGRVVTGPASQDLELINLQDHVHASDESSGEKH